MVSLSIPGAPLALFVLLPQRLPSCVALTHLHYPTNSRTKRQLQQAAFVASPSTGGVWAAGQINQTLRRTGLSVVTRHISATSSLAMATPGGATGGEFSAREWKDGEAHEVLPKVFLGSMEAAKDKESLKANGVTHILTVNGKDPMFKDDFEYKVISFGGDSGGLTPHLDESLKFVEDGVDAGGVLIHCTHGTGRSAAMTIAAVMKANGKASPGGVGSFTEAFQVVKARRPGTDPPMVFQRELGEWEEKAKSS